MNKLFAGTLLALSLTACADRTPQVIALQQPQAAVAQPGAMTVTGSATLEVSPDCADLTMTLSVDGARPGLAAGSLTKKQQAVVEAMKALGIEASDMKISYMSLNPIYKDWQQNKVITYRAEVTITATTKKFDQIASMMEAGATAGAQTMSTQFRRSDLPELKKRVRELALKAAKEKAQITTKALGIELGRVTAVAETPNGLMWSSHYFPNSVVNVSEQAPVAAQAAALGGALQPLTLDVTVSFELAKNA
jgi:uncharacterized protein